MPGIIYLVQQWHWRVREDDTEGVPDWDLRPDTRVHPDDPDMRQLLTYHRNPDEGGVPVRAFRDYQKAESFRREREKERREATNPFRYGWGMENRTSLDEGRLHDWLLDAGLTPPGPEGEAQPDRVQATWWKWWLRIRGRLKQKQKQDLVQALTSALAERGSVKADEPSPGDLIWLDYWLGRMDELTVMQRSNFRMMLVGINFDYPDIDGERDHYTVEAKWRDWWDENWHAMTEYQRHMVWEALDLVRFFELVELEEPEP